MVQCIGLSIARCWVLWWHCDLFTFRNGYLMFFPGCCTFPLHCLQDAWLITWSEKVCDWMQILHFSQHVVFYHIQVWESACSPPMCPRFDPAPVPCVGWVSCWFSSCSEGFSVGILVFVLPQKPTFPNSNSIKLKDRCFSCIFSL